MTRYLMWALLLALLLPSVSSAQARPEAAARAFGEALRDNDWAGAARLMHPGAIRELRELFEPFLETPDGAELRAQLFGVQSAAELASTPDTVLFAAFLRNVMGQEKGFAQAFRTASFTPLGHVRGGGDTVFVVSRMSMTIDSITITQFDVMPFLWENGRWWALLKADFRNMAAMLRQAFAAKS